MTASEPHFMQAQLHLKEAHLRSIGVAARKTEIGDGSIPMDQWVVRIYQGLDLQPNQTT